jgi:hypothetical protein
LKKISISPPRIQKVQRRPFSLSSAATKSQRIG